MTREETKKIAMIIQGSFPSWNVSDKTTLLDVWTKVFENDDYPAIEAALMDYIRTDKSGFAPSPGQIRGLMKDMSAELDDTEELIAMLRQALRNGSYGYEYEFEKMPPVLQRAVGKPITLQAWARDENFNEASAFAAVRRNIRQIRQQEKLLKAAQPVRNQDVLDARKRLQEIDRKPSDEMRSQRLLPKKEEPRLEKDGERKPYEPKLTEDEIDAIVRIWDRKPGKIMSRMFISPARDAFLRKTIDRIGIEEVIRMEDASEANSFGDFLEELKEAAG